MQNGKILVIEDNAHLRKFITNNLVKSGYQVFQADSLKTAYVELKAHVIDLVLLDLQLGQNDGMEILKTIRRQNKVLPVIIVSSITNVDMKVSGFDIGCDDYITKPFYIDELLGRVKRIFNRMRSERPPHPIITEEIISGPFVLDMKTFTLTKNGEIIQMRKKLFELMLFFVRNPEIVLSKEMLFDRAWEFLDGMNANSLYVHINQLRILIEDDPNNPHYIKTIRNAGYFYSPGNGNSI